MSPEKSPRPIIEIAQSDLSRRTVVAAAAWSMPAVSVFAATPAMAAASGVAATTITGPAGGIPARGTAPITVTAKDAQGQPLSGRPVSLTPPAPGSFAQPDGVTDGAGVYTTSFTLGTPWAQPGSSVAISATVAGTTTSQSFTVLGANALGFGYNAWAELGDGGQTGGGSPGSGVARSTPSQFLTVFPSPVVQMVSTGPGTSVASNHTTFALLADGTVWAVGGNGFGQLGVSGNNRETWAAVPGLTGVQQISAGNVSVYALLSSGKVMAWGDNYFGQIGSNAPVGGASSTPVEVAGISGVKQVSAGTQQCFFLLADGTVWAIGRNTFDAALGNGSNVAQSATPVQVSGLTGITQIAGFAQGGYAVKSDGTVWSWGSDYSGALGKGTTPVPPPWSSSAPVYSSSTPVQVVGLSGKTAVQVAGAGGGGVVRTSDGAVFAWGENSAGFVGDGTTTSRSSATPVSGLTSGVEQIAASGGSAYAVKSDGSVAAWGDNSSGQLGSGTTANATTPTAVGGLTGLSVGGLMTHSPATSRMYILTAEQTISASAPSQVAAGAASTVEATVRAGSNGVSGVTVSFEASGNTTLSAASAATSSSGVAQVSATPDGWTTPGTVLQFTATAASGSSFTRATVRGANVLGFGLNQWNELGDGGPAGGDTDGAGVARSTPSQLMRTFPSPVKQIVSTGAGTRGGSNHSSIALLEDGTVWSVGGNGYGQLGNGTTSPRTMWAQIPSLAQVQQISAANETVYALLANGKVMAWGDNFAGQLGTNTSAAASATPIEIGELSGIAQVGAGTQQCFFLLTDGTVWAIGRNTFHAALGDGSTVDSSAVPVRVAGLTDVVQIAGYAQGGYALKADGTVWAWGSDYAGALGKGTTPVPPQWSPSAPVYASSTPVQVQGLAGKTAVQVAGNFSGGVVRTADGAVFAWGDNQYGFVGDGSTTSRSSATAVSGLSSGVVQVTASGNSAYARTSTGTVLAWGDNSAGQLGTGNTTNATAPVTVTGLSGLAVAGFMTNSPSTNRMYVYTGSTALTVQIDAQVPAGAAGSVQAKVAAGSQPVAGAQIGLTATGGATLGSSGGTTGSGGVYTTTVSVDEWAAPGSVRRVTARSGGDVAFSTFVTLGANAAACGSDPAGRLGTRAQSDMAARSQPVHLLSAFPSPIVQALATSDNSQSSAVLLADGTVWTTGAFDFGQLGDGSTAPRNDWKQVPGLTGVTQMAAFSLGFYALSGGSIWAWGDNTFGQIGNGTFTQANTPAKVSGISTAKAVVGGAQQGYALLSDGTVMGWGRGDVGFGGAPVSDRSTPAAVPGVSGAIQIAAAAGVAFALLSDGTVRSWGANWAGQAGQGQPTSNSPLPVGAVVGAGGTTLSGVSRISSGGTTGFALMSDKTLQTWGGNGSGQLGSGSSAAQAVSAATVNGLSNVVSVSPTAKTAFAFTTDGKLWGWGDNSVGQLGDGSTTNRSTPATLNPVTGQAVTGVVTNSTSTTATYFLTAVS